MHTSLLSHFALDKLVRWVPQQPGKAAFYSGLDEATMTVRVMGAGVWRVDDAERYHEQQRRVLNEARRRYGSLKIFFDVRHWIVESPDSAIQFQAMNAELHRPDDRLTAIVNASVLKQHVRTALSVGQCEVFLSSNAAETWLQAYANTSSSIR